MLTQTLTPLYSRPSTLFYSQSSCASSYLRNKASNFSISNISTITSYIGSLIDSRPAKSCNLQLLAILSFHSLCSSLLRQLNTTALNSLLDRLLQSVYIGSASLNLSNTLTIFEIHSTFILLANMQLII